MMDKEVVNYLVGLSFGKQVLYGQLPLYLII